jgi:hypothetical protein
MKRLQNFGREVYMYETFLKSLYVRDIFEEED